jgi:glyoxylase-like metal-dependent hydrolase (beta-lactamase superfamily II)
MDMQRIDLGFVNAYLIRAGQGFVLVDSGVPASRERLEKALQEAGCGPGQLKLVIATHGDIDHIGCCAHMQRQGARIAMHEGDAQMAIHGGFNLSRKTRGFFKGLLMPLLRRSGRYKRLLADFERFTPDLLLSDGQSLREFGWEAQVLHIPGHTAGSIGILDAGGDLIAGDTFSNRSRPEGASYILDEGQLKTSMARLKSLAIQTVHPGHGKPFAMKELAL